jgi:hypothetical protein
MLKTDSSQFTAIIFVPIPTSALLMDEVCRRVTALTQVLSGECTLLFGLHERPCGFEGDFVECGVNAGFVSSAIMKKLQWNTLGRRFYLIDTFTGPVLTQYSQEEVQKDRRKGCP